MVDLDATGPVKLHSRRVPVDSFILTVQTAFVTASRKIEMKPDLYSTAMQLRKDTIAVLATIAWVQVRFGKCPAPNSSAKNIHVWAVYTCGASEPEEMNMTVERQTEKAYLAPTACMIMGPHTEYGGPEHRF